MLTLVLLLACGSGPDAQGWFKVEGGKVRVHANELGPGCVLIGGRYGEYTLDPEDRVRPDPTIEQCDAFLELDGVSVVLAGDEGGIHAAYEPIDLQPLLVMADSVYFNMKGVSEPGVFSMPLVIDVGGEQLVETLRVDAVER